MIFKTETKKSWLFGTTYIATATDTEGKILATGKGKTLNQARNAMTHKLFAAMGWLEFVQ